MKIISKYKDYYDYLMGIYGIDEKLVLDRRNFDHRDFYDTPISLQVYICGMAYQGYYDGEKFYYGEGLYKVGQDYDEWVKKNRTGWWLKYHRPNKIKQVVIKKPKNYQGLISGGGSDYIRGSGSDYLHFAVEPYIDIGKLNEKRDCPIVVEVYGDRFDFHPLNKIGFGSVIDPHVIFNSLSNWLSKKITEKEVIKDSRTEHQRIESRGFDKKRSFRPKMK